MDNKELDCIIKQCMQIQNEPISELNTNLKRQLRQQENKNTSIWWMIPLYSLAIFSLLLLLTLYFLESKIIIISILIISTSTLVSSIVITIIGIKLFYIKEEVSI